MAKDKTEQQGKNNQLPYDIAERFTLDGSPIFEYINIDNETGDITYKLHPGIEEDLKEAQQGAAANIVDLIEKMITGNPPYEQLQQWQIILDTFYKAANAGEALIDELRELRPYISAELEKGNYKILNEYKEKEERYTLSEILDLLIDPNSDFAPILDAARAAKIAKEQLAQTTITRAEIIEYPLDKPNSNIWNLLEKDTGGQIKFDMLGAGGRRKKDKDLQATAIYSINFDNLDSDLQITKRLTPYDKRVYIAVSALFNAGNEIITLSQIYYAMGYTGNPGAKDLKRINDAITKMKGDEIFFDNEVEAKALTGYLHFKYDGSLLPFERITVFVNGKLSERAIKPFREPPLMSFAKERNQVTTISVKLLQSPLSKTDANLQIEDYLLERISKAKNKKNNKSYCKILYNTIFEKTHITTSKQKQRAPEKIEKILRFYQKEKFLKKYIMQDDGITIYF